MGRGQGAREPDAVAGGKSVNLAFNPSLHWLGNYLMYGCGVIGYVSRDGNVWAGTLTSSQFRSYSTDLDAVKAELKAAAEARLLLGRCRGW